VVDFTPLNVNENQQDKLLSPNQRILETILPDRIREISEITTTRVDPTINKGMLRISLKIGGQMNLRETIIRDSTTRINKFNRIPEQN